MNIRETSKFIKKKEEFWPSCLAFSATEGKFIILTPQRWKTLNFTARSLACWYHNDDDTFSWQLFSCSTFFFHVECKALPSVVLTNTSERGEVTCLFNEVGLRFLWMSSKKFLRRQECVNRALEHVEGAHALDCSHSLCTPYVPYGLVPYVPFFIWRLARRFSSYVIPSFRL